MSDESDVAMPPASQRLANHAPSPLDFIDEGSVLTCCDKTGMQMGISENRGP